MPSTPTMTFCGETSRWTMSSDSPISSRASCAAKRPASISAAMATTTPTGSTTWASRAARSSLSRGSPCTYSCTSSTSAPVWTTSSTGTTLGWWTLEAMRASSRNIARKSGSSANWGCSRFTATIRLKPSAPSRRARWMVAMPPRAMGAWRM